MSSLYWNHNPHPGQLMYSVHFASYNAQYKPKRTRALLHALKPRHIKTVTIFDHEGKENSVQALSLKPDAFKGFVQRYNDNGGAVAIENLSDVFPELTKMRRFLMGLSYQAAKSTAIGNKVSPYNVRVVGEKNRTKEQVRHVDELHFDCGLEDPAACRSNQMDVAAIMIADGPYVNTLPGQFSRLLARSSDFTGKNELSVYPRTTTKEDLPLLHEINAHRGSLVFHSNINDPAHGIQRWGHIVLPEQFTPSLITNLKNGQVRLNGGIVENIRAMGASNQDIEKLKTRLKERIDRFTQQAHEKLRQVQQDINAAKADRDKISAARIAELKRMVAQIGDTPTTQQFKELQKITTSLSRIAGDKPEPVKGEWRLRLYTPGEIRYNRAMLDIQTQTLKSFLRQRFGFDFEGRRELPYALFQLTTENKLTSHAPRQSDLATIRSYIETGVTIQ